VGRNDAAQIIHEAWGRNEVRPQGYRFSFLAIDRGADKIENIGDDARGRVIGYDIAVVIAILITGWRRDLCVIGTWNSLEVIATGDALPTFEMGPPMRIVLPTADVFLVMGREVTPILVVKPEVLAVLIMVVVVLIVMVVVIVMMIVALALCDAGGDGEDQNWNAHTL